MRNAKRFIPMKVLSASVLSMVLVGAAHAAGGMGFQPWTDARIQDSTVGQPGLVTEIGFHPGTNSQLREREVAEPYQGGRNWTDSLKCMTSASYCHRFDAVPVKAEVSIR